MCVIRRRNSAVIYIRHFIPFLAATMLLLMGAIPVIAAVVQSVSSSSPDGAYRATETITITVDFDVAVTVDTVSGTPRLLLKTGITDDYANYSSGSGNIRLYFTYSVLGDDNTNDLDYKFTTSLEANGGTIKDGGGVDAVLTLVAPGAIGSLGANKNIVLDTVKATISSGTAAADNSYVDVTFSEGIYSTASESGALDPSDLVAVMTANGGQATLASVTALSKTNGNPLAGNETVMRVLLTFNFPPSGIETVEIQPASGTSVYDRAGNSTLPTETTGPVSLADQAPPSVTQVSSTNADNSYRAGQTISITVKFTESVTVNITGGTPQIYLETGSTDRYAGYVSGSGFDTLVFNYIVIDGDYSSDLTYQNANSLQLNNGTIKDSGGLSANATLPSPGSGTSLSWLKNIVIDTQVPTLSSGLVGPGNAYVEITMFEGAYTLPDGTGALVKDDFQISFLQNGGTATDTTISGITSVAGGAVAAGDTKVRLLLAVTGSASGVETVEIKPANSGAIFDKAGNPMAVTQSTGAKTLTDVNAPSVTSVTSTKASGTYKTTDIIPVQLIFSDLVYVTGFPRVKLETGTTDRYATYASGNGTTTLTFNYTVVAGDYSPDLDVTGIDSLELNSGTIKDAGGNPANLALPSPGGAGSLGAAKDIRIDAKSPIITSANLAADNSYLEIVFDEGVYTNGDGTGVLVPTDFSLVFNKNSGSATNVVIDSLTNNLGAGLSGGELIVRAVLTITGNPSGVETITVTPASAASIYDAQGNAMASSQTTGAKTLSDQLSATVTNVSSTNANSTYKAGDIITVTTTFSDTVTVTGTPRILLETGTIDRYANYSGGNGTTILSFSYTIVSGDNTTDLDYVATTSLEAYGGTIKDGSGIDATRTLPPPGGTGSLKANKDIKIDGVLPVVTAVTSTKVDGAYKAGEVIDIQVTFTKDVTVTLGAKPFGVTVETGSPDRRAVYVSGSAGKVLLFRYTVLAGDNSEDLDYTGVTALAANDTLVKDSAGNSADLTLPAPGTSGSISFSKAIVVDTTAPKVNSVASSSGNATYGPGQQVLLTVTMSEIVTVDTVSGVPTLLLETGATDRQATYTSGSESTVLTFTYTVITGDASSDLDYKAANSLETNGGKILDRSLNPLVLTLPAPAAAGSLGANAAIVIDGESAHVTSVTTDTADGSYGQGKVIDVKVVFSEAVVVTGTPKLMLETGITDREASCIAGTGTSILSFRYTVQAGDGNPDLDVTGIDALVLAGATIKDTIGNTAVTTVPFPGTTGSLSSNKDLVIDTSIPRITGSSISTGNDWIRIDFSERVWSDSGHSTGLTSADFTVNFQSNGGGALSASIVSVLGVSNESLDGGEMSVKLIISYNGTPSGVETLKITTADGASIYDNAGNPVPAGDTTSTFTLKREVVFVRAGATGSGNGTSWTNAYPSLATALSVHTGKVEIWVAEGTYTPSSTGDRGASFTLHDGTSLYGGFSGEELTRGEKNPKANKTILSGDIGIQGVNTDNNYHVVRGSGGALIDGFTITAGRANGASEIDMKGGGVTFGPGSGKFTLVDCLVTGNTSSLHGAGIYIDAAEVEISSSRVTGNTAGQQGGGIFFTNCYSGKVKKSWFDGNSALRGGGGTSHFSTIPFENCVFSNNSATEKGGGLYSVSYAPTLLNCTLSGNSSASGGGLYNHSCNTTVKNTIIWNNANEVTNYSCSPVFTNSDVRGCGGSGAGWNSAFGTNGGGNIDSDPKFVTPDMPEGPDGIAPSADDGLALGTGSPCIDTASAAGAPTQDAAGAARPDGAGMDMGAYEGMADGMPKVLAVTSTDANGSYMAGEIITGRVTFSESVNVTGTPRLKLETGATDRYALFSGGGGTATLLFSYTILTTDSSEDLDQAGTDALELNGGTIRGVGGKDARLTLPAPGSAGSLGGSRAIVVDTTAPTIVSGVIDAGNTWMDVDFGEGVYSVANETGAVDTGDLSLTFLANGGTATNVTLASVTRQDGTALAGGEQVVRVLLTVTGTPDGKETIEIKPANGTSIFDRAGNPLSAMATTGAKNLRNPLAPRVVSADVQETDGWFKAGQVLTVKVTFTEALTVGGSPSLLMETGTTDRKAVYSGGSGTAVLNFSYTVATGDASADLDYASATALALDGGTIRNATNLDAVLILPSPGAAGSISVTRALVIDTTAPTIQDKSLAADNGKLTLTLSEGIYTASNGTGAVTATDFTMVFSKNGGTAANATLVSITKVGGAALSGGESTFEAVLSITGTPNGLETIEFKPVGGSSVFDRAGNPMASLATTGPVALNAAGNGQIPVITPKIPSLWAEKGIPIIIDLTPHESDQEDGVGALSLRWSIEGVSNFTYSGAGSDDDRLILTPEASFTGKKTVKFVLEDSDGNKARQDVDIFWLTPVSAKLTPASVSSSLTPHPGYGTDTLTDSQMSFQGDFAAYSASRTTMDLRIDLGSEKVVGRALLWNDGKYGAKVASVHVAREATPSTFEKVGESSGLVASGQAPCRNFLNFRPALGRYVKITLTAFADQYWLQLNEVEIWGWSISAPGLLTTAGATTSVAEVTGHGPETLIDGESDPDGDFAVPNSTAAVEIVIDLGSNQQIAGFNSINDGRFGARKVTASTAADSATPSYTMAGVWESLTVTTSGPGLNSLYFGPRSARYLKLLYEDFNDGTYFQLNEIEPIGEGGSQSDQEADLIPVSASCSPTAITGYGVRSLFDGAIAYNEDFAVDNKGARVTVTYDLRSNMRFSKILHYNDGEYGAKAVKVEASSDSSPSAFFSVTTGDVLTMNVGAPGLDTLSFAEKTARYIRFTYDTFWNARWFQLNEITIRGPAGQTGTTSDLTITAVTSSPSAYPGYGPDKLYDDNVSYNSDYAVLNQGAQVDVTVDLGSDTTFNSIEIVNDGEYGAKTVSLAYATSSLPSSFSDLGTYTGLIATAGQPSSNRISFQARTARYLRVRASAFAHPSWFQLNEVRVLNLSGPVETKYGIVSVVSSISSWPGFPPEKTFDGQKVYNGDFACRNAGTVVTITFDLGADRDVSAVVHVNDGEYGARAVIVSFSRAANPNAFSTATSSTTLKVTAGSPNEDRLTFTTANGRYFKLSYSSFSNPAWFQLNEVEFYGSVSSSEPPAMARAESALRDPGATAVPVPVVLMTTHAQETRPDSRAKKNTGTKAAPEPDVNFYILVSDGIAAPADLSSKTRDDGHQGTITLTLSPFGDGGLVILPDGSILCRPYPAIDLALLTREDLTATFPLHLRELRISYPEVMSHETESPDSGPHFKGLIALYGLAGVVVKSKNESFVRSETDGFDAWLGEWMASSERPDAAWLAARALNLLDSAGNELPAPVRTALAGPLSDVLAGNGHVHPETGTALKRASLSLASFLVGRCGCQVPCDGPCQSPAPASWDESALFRVLVDLLAKAAEKGGEER